MYDGRRSGDAGRVADCVLFALTRPLHVNVDEIVIKALAQSSGGRIVRREDVAARCSRSSRDRRSASATTAATSPPRRAGSSRTTRASSRGSCFGSTASSPLLLSSGRVEHFTAAFYLRNGTANGLPRDALSIARERFVGTGMQERITRSQREHGAARVRALARGRRRLRGHHLGEAPRLRARRPGARAAAPAPGAGHATTRRAASSRSSIRAGDLEHAARLLEGRSSSSGSDDLRPLARPARALGSPSRRRSLARRRARRRADRAARRRARDARATSSPPGRSASRASAAGWESLRRAFDRSIADLAALRMRTGEYRRPLFAAGMPWFMTVFGRDTAITSLQTLLLGPEIAVGALDALAELQAHDRGSRRSTPSRGRSSTRCAHGRCAETWFPRYYGSIDATPLFLVLLAETWRWTDDACARADGCASRRCSRSSGSTGTATGTATASSSTAGARTRGLANQSWKDSGDSQRFHDGRFAEPPIAPVEVQGYVYDAKRGLAELAREVWRDHALAERLEREADELRARFDEAFWVEERGGFYALALDGKKRPRRLALLEHGPPALERHRAPGARSARSSTSSSRRSSGRAGGSARWRATRPRTTRSATTTARSGRTTRRSPPGASRGTATSAEARRHRARARSRRPRTSTGRCRRCSPATRATRRRSRSRIRPPRARRPGRPARRSSSSASFSGSSPTARASGSSRP